MDSKSLKIEDIDRISNMPDLILGKILSCLPTKYAVGTSILSTRWKNLFPFCVPNIKLVFDDSLLLNPVREISTSTSFVDFVDRLLNRILLSDHVSIVESMTLECNNKYGARKIASWIRAAVRLNIRELILVFNCHVFDDDDDSKILFDTLNGCTTLSRLVLGRNIRWRVPRNFMLPSLKTLHLSKVTFSDEDNLMKSDNLLVDACPALQELNLRHCNLQNMTLFCIQSPSLKILKILCLGTSSSEVILDCPNLDSLSLTDWVNVKGNYPSKFKSPRQVDIDVCRTHNHVNLFQNNHDGSWYNGLVKLVAACSGTSKLRLSLRSLCTLCFPTVRLPVFQNLSSLALGSKNLSSVALGLLGVHQWALLARLLLNAPNLKQLTIGEGFKGDIGGYAEFQNLLSSPPLCLELRIKRINFMIFKGDEDEIKLIEYFLKNGQILKKLKLHCAPSVDMVGIRKNVLLLPRRSKSCEIFITLKRE